jgi:hypothetical protein
MQLCCPVSTTFLGIIIVVYGEGGVVRSQGKIRELFLLKFGVNRDYGNIIY